MDSVKNWKRKLKGEKFLLYHLPSTIYHLLSTIYHLPSTIYYLPSPVFCHPVILSSCHPGSRFLLSNIKIGKIRPITQIENDPKSHPYPLSLIPYSSPSPWDDTFKFKMEKQNYLRKRSKSDMTRFARSAPNIPIPHIPKNNVFR